MRGPKDWAYYRAHLERVNAAMDPEQAAATVADWICKHTSLGGKKFSFLHHEYQKTLLDDPTQVKYVRKCSQIGISEISVRRVIAVTQLHAAINVLYILPSASFASVFSSTRLASALDSSPVAKAALYRTDSATVKRFFNESFIYFKGASRGGQAISIPASGGIVVDEVDFCEDQDVLTSFTSRMTHADPKVAAQWWFSTPTVTGYGISHLFDNSKQFVELQRCNHCNHRFIADYYENVKLPGFNSPKLGLKGPAGHVKTDRNLLEFNFLNKILLTEFDLKTAFLACPKCGKACDQSIKYREFVCVNPDSNFEEHGYDISPFAAPIHMPPSKMIKTSTMYKATKDFVNSCLGCPHEDSTTGLSEEEINALFRTDIDYPDNPPFQISGTDMGGSCAHLTAYPAPDGHIRIMSARLIPLNKFKEDYPKSLGANNVISSVIDLLPYTDLVAEMQSRVPTLFACVFTNTKGVELYSIRDKEEDESKASYGVHQVNAKKNALLDFVVNMIRAKRISFAQGTFDEQEVISAHLRDMKRVEITNKDGEREFVWRKSTGGQDHYMHALAYLILADFLKGLSTGMVPLPLLAGKFKTKGGL